MNKFCTKCGSQMDSEAKLCVNCGAVQPSIPVMPPKDSGSVISQVVDPVKHKGKLTDKLVGIAAMSIMVLIVIFVGVKVFGTPAYEKPIKYLMTSMEKGSFKDFKKALPPMYFEDSDMEDEMKSYFKMATKSMDDVKISYKITSKEKVSKSELKTIQKDYQNYFDKSVKVNAGYTLEIKITTKSGKDKDTNYETLNVYKINGKWYLDIENLY